MAVGLDWGAEHTGLSCCPRSHHKALRDSFVYCETVVVSVHLEHEVSEGLTRMIGDFELEQALGCHVAYSLHCSFNLDASGLLLRALLSL